MKKEKQSLNRPLVSIIVPAYNAEKHIEESLLSLVQQSWENLEIIVVDDGSTDQTPAIVHQLSNSHPLISLYEKENGGVSSARNLGLSMAKGTYIAMQDADDISLPERIEKQVHFLEQNNLALCGCGLSIFGGRKNRDKLFPVSDAELKSNFLFFGRTIAGPALLYKKEYAEGLRFDESLSYGEDFDFILRMAFLHDNRVGNIPELLYRYRQHEHQATGRLEHTNRVNMIKILRAFIVEQGLDVTDDVVACHFDLCKTGGKASCSPDLRFYKNLLELLEASGGHPGCIANRLYIILKEARFSSAETEPELLKTLGRKLPFTKRARLAFGLL